MSGIEKILKLGTSKYEQWQESVDFYIDTLFRSEKYSSEESIDAVHKVNLLFKDFADLFYKYGMFKDNFDDDYFRMHPGGQYLILKSNKTNFSIDIGIDVFNGTFYLSSTIDSFKNMKYMDDSFWLQVLSLNDVGTFKFQENNCISVKEERYFNGKKSTLFKLLRNYMIFEIEHLERDEEVDQNISLGYWVIEWKIDNSWEYLLTKSCEAFKIIYNLNYQLWKFSDIRQKQKAKSK